MVRCRRLLDKKGLDTDSHPCIPDPSEISPLKVPSDTVLSFFFFYFFLVFQFIPDRLRVA